MIMESFLQIKNTQIQHLLKHGKGHVLTRQQSAEAEKWPISKWACGPWFAMSPPLPLVPRHSATTPAWSVFMHLARSIPVADAASAAPNATTSRPMPWEVCTSEPGMTAARAQPGRRVSSRNEWASAASVVRLQPLPVLPTRFGTSGARAGTLPASSVQMDAKSLVKQLFAQESPGLSMLVPLIALCSQEGLRGRPGICPLQAKSRPVLS